MSSPSSQGVTKWGFPLDLANQTGHEYLNFQKTKQFGSLDGLRCISILAVIWHHGPGQRMLGFGFRGMLGVHLFFAISGFLITTLLIREKEKNGHIAIKKFYARRILRIFPLYYTMLALYVAILLVIGRKGEDLFFHALPSFITYTSNWFTREDVIIFGFAWSLATEEQFYATWPWFERYLSTRRAFLVMALFTFAIIFWHILHPGVNLSSPLYLRILSRFAPAILMGVLLAHILHERVGYAIAFKLFGYRWSSGAILIALLVLIALPAPRVVIYLFMALLVGSCVVREDHWLAPVLRTAFFVRIGIVSYGIYMIHNLVYDVLERIAGLLGMRSFRGSIIEFVVCVGVTFAVASLSFRYYEGIFLKLKGRYSI
jgi:peptidoglycan/LPS O-acetylase OafA/YrhL